VDVLRLVLNTVDIDGVVLIEEGEKGEAPVLFGGERLGTGPRCQSQTQRWMTSQSLSWIAPIMPSWSAKSESLAIHCNASCLPRFYQFLTTCPICAILGGPVRCQWSSLRSVTLDTFPVSLKTCLTCGLFDTRYVWSVSGDL
jgi:hypothetical protein